MDTVGHAMTPCNEPTDLSPLACCFGLSYTTMHIVTGLLMMQSKNTNNSCALQHARK